MAFERMANRYSTQKDLCDRLHGTICRYKDIPVVVSFVTVEQLHLADIVSGELLAKINPSDPDFDISSPELGYFNYIEEEEHSVIYVTRLPVRRYRQGLYGQCCSYVSISGETVRGRYNKSYFSTQGFKNSVMNNFPALGVARAILQNASEIAISREVALQKTDSGLILVYFKTKNIGWIKPDSNEVEMLVGEFDWVAERYLNRLGLVVKEKIIGHSS